jgi:acetyltransferase-like isoleucine patch superfamily enzyme
MYSAIYTLYLKFFFKNINISGHIISNGFFNIEISKNAKLDISGKIALRSNTLIAIRNGAKLTIGDGCFFNRNVSIVCREEIKIGKNSIFGENVKIYDNDHRVVNGITCHNVFDTKKIIIGDNCWVGNDVNILKGSIIKNKTIVGAMSLVKGELYKEGIYVGIPVKLLPYTKAKVD